MRFGLDAPKRPGDFGLVVESGMAWLVRAMEADETLKRGKAGAGDDEELHIQRLMPADALRLRGRHNAANALAALALATAIGCPLAPMLHGLRDPISINKEAYNKDGALSMPAMGMALDDAKIAGVLTFVRREWGDFAAPVSVEIFFTPASLL